MSLIVNHNMMAMNTTRNLNTAYGRLATSVQRLSSGLRINSAADDAAGLAIREMMRADIATTMQGLRNAADGISLIQTADGALSVIDEKLVRMKELAEQAATGTYTTAQREIINSEYQAMANEIDRIANATNFNGIKLLDGSISNLHGGRGLKVHFGVGNSPAEDYYFVNMGDARATSKTGLRIGGDAKNDIWGQGAAGAVGMAGPGCCTTGFKSLNDPAGFIDGQSFSYGYNWDWVAHNAPGYANGGNTIDHHDLLTGKYLAGRYSVTSADSLQDLVNKVNAGTQSRVGIRIDATDNGLFLNSGASMGICVGEEAYIWGDLTAATGGSAMVAQWAYTFKPFGYWSNADNTVMTNSATVASALGFSRDGMTFTAVMQRTTDAEGAAAEINRQINMTLSNGRFVGAVSGRMALSATGSAGLYNKALEYMNLDKKVSQPQLVTARDIERTGWKVVYASGATNRLSAAAVSLSNIYKWAIDPGQTMPPNFGSQAVTGDKVVSLNIWISKDGKQWTNSATIGKQLEAWNEGGIGNWSRLAVEVVAGDTYDDIHRKFLDKINIGPAATEVTDITVLSRASGGTIAGTSAFGIWFSASAGGSGFWTTVQGVASALQLTHSLGLGNFSAGSSLTGILFKVNSAIAHYSSAWGSEQVFSTHAFTGKTGSVGINFWTNGNGNWTDDKALGEAMGFNQVILNLTYNQRIDSIMSQLDQAIGSAAGTGRGTTYFGSVTFAQAGISIAPQKASDIIGTADRKDDIVVMLNGFVDATKQINLVGTGQPGYFTAFSLASAINHNKNSQFWAMMDRNDPSQSTLYVFNKEGGDNNSILACDVYDIDNISQGVIQKYVNFENVATGFWHRGGTNMSLGTNAADVWAKMKPVQTKEAQGNAVWNVTLNGKDVGNARDLWITAARELILPGLGTGTNRGFEDIINGLDRYSFVEIQNAADGLWAGADVRTQSHAQEALDALNYSINVKDKVRADLGAVQNRLENTMTNLEIQAENLQASESRISDVDVAKEMTEFTKNNVLTQAAVGMLSQANSLGQLALSLIGG